MSKQTGDRIHENECDGNTGSLFSFGPAHEEQEWTQKYPAANSGQSGKETDCSPENQRESDRDQFGLLRIGSPRAEKQTHSTVKQHRTHQPFVDFFCKEQPTTEKRRG